MKPVSHAKPILGLNNTLFMLRKNTMLWLLMSLMFIPLVHASTGASASKFAHLNATEIMVESLKRHEWYPYVYEEQTLVLVDDQKHKNVRRMQRYSRLEQNGEFKTMLKFIYPVEIAGSSLLFVRLQNGVYHSRFYLPAFGMQSMQYLGATASSQLLGSEFSSEELMPEDMHAFEYRRLDDVEVDETSYFVIQALSTENSVLAHSYFSRQFMMRQDNFFITSINYFDAKHQLLKRQTRHDIHPVSGMMWRADMIMVENFLNHHRSILKIDGRIFSKDYVPDLIFNLPKDMKTKAISESPIRHVDHEVKR